jgi:uncharacterized membrane protein
MLDFIRDRPGVFVPVLWLLTAMSAFSSYIENRDFLLIVFLLLGSSVFVVILKTSVADYRRDAFYETLIGFIGLSLMLSQSLTSNSLLGWDIHQEFYVFLQVSRTGHWFSQSTTLYNSVLSVGILPTILSLVSGIDGVFIFKFVFPAIFSFVPVVLYRVYRRFVGSEASFLSVFLLVSYAPFYYELISIARQEVAEFLLVVALLVLFTQETKLTHWGLVLTFLLTFGIVVSHYSLAYLYLLFLAVSYIMLRRAHMLAIANMAVYVAFSAVLTFLWYAYLVSNFELTSLAALASSIISGLGADFLNPLSRPSEAVQVATGFFERGLVFQAYRAAALSLNLILVLGFVYLATKRHKSAGEVMILPFMTAALILLGSSVIFPYFAQGLNLSRIYHVALLFLSPCFAYGISWLQSALRRMMPISDKPLLRMRLPVSRKWILAACSYFMFNSGVVQAVTLDKPVSVILDSDRMARSTDLAVKSYLFSYKSSAQDVAGASWLGQHIQVGTSVCADAGTRIGVLASYAGLGEALPAFPFGCEFADSYVFLSLLNSGYGIIDWYGANYPLSDFSGRLTNENRIYSGGPSVYISPMFQHG